MPQSRKDFASRLEAIINTAIDGIINIDTRGVIEIINPAGCKLFGYEAHEVVGKNIKVLMPEPYHSEHDGYMERYHRTQEPHIIGIGREVKGKRKDGTIFPLRLAVSETTLDDRTIYTGIIHDLSDVKEAQKETERLNQELEKKVTQRTYELEEVVNQLLQANTSLEVEIHERKSAEQRLRESEEELRQSLNAEKELNELKSRFVSMASHEFRTPLASVLSSAALLSRYVTAEQQPKRDKHIGRIKNAVNTLTGILNDFLSLSKLEEGKVEVILEEHNLEELCEYILDDLKGLLKEDQEIVRKTTGKSRPVLVDKRILKNIIFNLISNAIKYSDKNITCEIDYSDQDYMIKIKDEGIGIPMEDQKYLFQRFFRAGNVTNIQGTGLGLNIVQRYVHLLGGEISFMSEHKVGTTFKISLPYNKEKVG